MRDFKWTFFIAYLHKYFDDFECNQLIIVSTSIYVSILVTFAKNWKTAVPTRIINVSFMVLWIYIVMDFITVICKL